MRRYTPRAPPCHIYRYLCISFASTFVPRAVRIVRAHCASPLKLSPEERGGRRYRRTSDIHTLVLSLEGTWEEFIVIYRRLKPYASRRFSLLVTFRATRRDERKREKKRERETRTASAPAVNIIYSNPSLVNLTHRSI